MKTENKLKNILTKNGFKPIRIVRRDGFERYNSVLRDYKGKKYFMKATIGKGSYRYRSLYNEAKISDFLSGFLTKKVTKNINYRLAVPKVKKIILEDDFLIFISHFISGKKVSLYNKQTQVNIVKESIDLVGMIDSEKEFKSINNLFKKYDRLHLIAMSPLRFIKAIFYSKVSLVKLSKVYFNFMKILFTNLVKYSLVHPDINTSNIIIQKRKIYITDWEEAGWGISAYNSTTPTLLYQKYRVQNKKVQRILRSLLAYRILVFFNQKIHAGDKRSLRDVGFVDKFLI